MRLLRRYVAACPQGVSRCTGRITVKLRLRSRRTGRTFRLFLTGKVGPRSIAGGTEQRISFRLNRRGRRLLRRLGSFDAVLRGSIRSDGGPAIVRQVGVWVVAPPRS